jgi:hypothetical protein
MEFNLIGLTAALAAFFGIWFGHVAVRKIEFVSASIVIPAVFAILIGLSMEIIGLFSANLYVTTALGILGITFLWDAFEFTRQQRRIQSGHAPANLHNPRHARILTESSTATTVDWLKRNPTGRQISADELRAMSEKSI